MESEETPDFREQAVLCGDTGRILSEDSVEYMLFAVDDGNTSNSFSRLEKIRQAAVQLSEYLTRDYIWQRDTFRVELVNRKGLNYLYGVTQYGDAVGDEWLIVYMLRELTKSIPGVWARVCDNDGEFLLVEAANAVPGWLNPGVDSNRVWIHEGHLKVIPPSGVIMGLKETTESRAQNPCLTQILTLADAVRTIRTTPESLINIPSVENEAFYRLQKYPSHVTASIHYAKVVVPRKVAYILRKRPQAIAPATELFYSRDTLLLKRLFETENSKPFKFPPEDLVTVSVRFTKVLYAQLWAQRFKPSELWSAAFSFFLQQESSKKWELKADSEDEHFGTETKSNAMVDIGMKITCGFEMMAAIAKTSNDRTVREVAVILDDLEEDGDDVAALPTDDEIRTWEDGNREDDDRWLHIDFSDLERELDRGLRGDCEVPLYNSTMRSSCSDTENPRPGFGDPSLQTDLRRIVSQVQDFLNDSNAGIEGAECDGVNEFHDDDTDEEIDDDSVRFDEERFAMLLRETIGSIPADESQAVLRMAATAGEPKMPLGREQATPAHQNNSWNSCGDDEEKGILKLAAQFEAELRGHGALRLDSLVETKVMQTRSSMKTVPSTISSKGKIGKLKSSTATIRQEDAEKEDDNNVEIDINLAKNLLESLKSQGGMAGPAGSIIGMLGLSLPRDDDADGEEGNGIGSTE